MDITNLLISGAVGLVVGGGLVLLYLFIAGKDAKSKAKMVMDDSFFSPQGLFSHTLGCPLPQAPLQFRWLDLYFRELDQETSA